ncbi:putative reverse transcriptase domain-containing protein, partial [Tanacetum coccineum]
YLYEEMDPLNLPPPASESEPDNKIEVKNPIEHEDETIPVSIYEVGESSTVAIPQEDGDRLLSGFMRRDIDSLVGRMVNFSRRLCGCEMAYALVEKKGKVKDKFYGKLILDLGNDVRSTVEQGTAAMERLVEKLGNVNEKAECKKLKKELKEARLSNTFLHIQNERVERDLYWTRVLAHEFYQEMIRKGFVFEERLNEAIDVPIEDVKSSSLKEIMPPKPVHMTQAAMRRMIKESVDAAIAVERERQAKVRNDASGSGPVRGQNTAPAVRECTFAGFTKCNPTVFHGIEVAIELRRWFEKTKSVFGISKCAEGKKQLMTAEFCPIKEIQRLENELWNLKVKEYDIVAYTQRFNELALMCPTMVKPERVKVDAYIRGLTDNIKGEVVIKNAEPKGPNVVTGTFMLNNRYAPVLFDSGSDRSFVNTRFSSLLDIKPIKIEDSYEVNLADRRIVSTNTILKGYTLSLVNHIFKIDLIPIELGTFDVIIGMDWLVKNDAVIVCGKKVVRIPYENKTLIVEGNKGRSRLKVISCIKARKYVEQGCHFFGTCYEEEVQGETIGKRA